MNTDLEELEKKIHDAENGADKKPAPLSAEQDGKKIAVQAGMEFTGSIAVGVFIGVSLDNWLETTPIFMLVFFFLGVFTGFFNIYRVMNNMGSSVGYSELHRREKDAKTAPELKQTHEKTD